MHGPKSLFKVGTAAVAVVLLAAVCTASAGTWLSIESPGQVNQMNDDAAIKPVLSVGGSDLNGFTVRAEIPGLQLIAHDDNKIDSFVELTWPGAKPYGELGEPSIPVIRRLFTAPAGATVSLNVVPGDATLINNERAGDNLLLWPVQESVEKLPGAWENRSFSYTKETYGVDAELPAERAVVRELGIVRGQRLFQLDVYPVAYNPMQQTLTVWSDMVVDIRFSGGMVNTDVSPAAGFGDVVLNPEIVPARTARAGGNYLIIHAASFATEAGTFATAKSAQGFSVTTYSVAPGTSATTIKNYIQSLYGGPSSPEYILLIGDTDTVPHFVGQGEASPNTDLNYACVDGADYYPDIAIGRFPARTSAQLNAIINKTLNFENGPLADPDYVKRAVFMASSDNYTVSEGTHNYVIETHMLPNEIVSDKLYCVTYNATTQQVINSFSDGRFWGIFSGHGAETYWADGPHFDSGDFAQITDNNMFAFICSFSCVTGTYADNDECWMETWIREPNKGAITAWGSSVNSLWTEDDILEKVLFDAIYDEDQVEVKKEVGPIYNETKMRYLAHFGDTSRTRRYFEMYNLMGDPAVPFPGNCSDDGAIQLDRAKYACEDVASIRVSDCGLNLDDNVIETVVIAIGSDSEAEELVTLTETGPSSAAFDGSIVISTTDGAGVLLVAAGDTITATYDDAANGQGQPVTVTSTAVVDCTPPTISNVQVIGVEPRDATVQYDSNEMARGVVYYGLTCGSLADMASGGFNMSPTVAISGLQDNTTYYFAVESYDEAGNMAYDDNNGACYTFTTPEVPEFFTEQDPNDLDDLKLTFTPVGGVDYYDGCTEPIKALPTDPTGGTTLSLSDDDAEQITFSGTFSLYGTNYTSCYVCSNGYITFGTSDTEYSETLEDHFSLPRVAALFDDLAPNNGGTISWKDLGDHVAITWDGVPEYSSSNSNTFQIELFYDGTITISHLAVASADHIVGLSDGSGLSPDYFPSDLSNMGSCGPRPPHAASGSVQTNVNEAVTVELVATDDGLPDPPAAITLILTSLPMHGTLADAGAGAITSVPYTLAGDGTQVIYTPTQWYGGPDSFQFKANDGGVAPEGGDSTTATISIVVGGPQVVHSFPMDTDPGWMYEGQWAFGTPTGGGSHNYDPTSGYTGDNVVGFNLAGDYSNNMARFNVTTKPMDCTDVTDVTLKFWRWLGVESASYDHAGIEISNDGATWVSIWEHTGGAVSDNGWQQVEFDISDIADNQASVYIRWAMGTTDSSVTYPGWNIDDVEIWGLVPVTPPDECPGDANCDGSISWRDIDYFVAGMNDNQAAWEDMFLPGAPSCPFANCDVNEDGTVSWRDIDPFVAVMNTVCP